MSGIRRAVEDVTELTEAFEGYLEEAGEEVAEGLTAPVDGAVLEAGGVVWDGVGDVPVAYDPPPVLPSSLVDARRKDGRVTRVASLGQARPPVPSGRPRGMGWLEEYAPDRVRWARQDREPPRAYNAFVIFRDIPANERNLRIVGERLARGTAQLRQWANLWRWEERAGYWDDAQRQVVDNEKRAQQKRAVDLHEKSSRALLGQVGRVIQREQQSAVPDAQNLQRAGIAMDKAIHHNRLALGLPTDMTRQDVELRNQIREMLQVADGVRAVIEEALCPVCRSKVATELRRLAEQQRRVREAQIV